MSELKTIPYYIPPRNHPSEAKKNYKYIPRKIFKTWRTNEVSSDMYDAVYTWIDKNPDWEFYLFDNQACRDFIKNNFPKEVVDTYDNIIPGAYKADLWRYCVLYIHGGIYSDIKQELVAELDKIIPSDAEFISIKDIQKSDYEFDGYIYQAFLCAKPKHPFFKKAIDMIIDNSRSGYYGNDPLSITGPGLLGRAINKCLKRDNKTPIKEGKNSIQGFNFELFSHKKSTIVTTTKDVFLNTVYNSNYKTELHKNLNKNIEKNYSLCWFNGKCYAHNQVNRVNSKFFNKRKGRYIIDLLYLQEKYTKARLTTLKFIILQPLRAYFLIRKVIKNEKVINQKV